MYIIINAANATLDLMNEGSTCTHWGGRCHTQ